MVDMDIVNDVLYLVVDNDGEVFEAMTSHEFNRLCDSHPRIKVEIIYRDEVH